MRLALGISISRASGEEKATGGKVTLDDVEGSIKYVLSHKVKELSQTASLIDSDDFSAVVNLLHNANLVLIAGVGNSISMGVNAAFKLSQVAFSAFFSGLLPLSDSLVIELADRSGLDFSRIRMGGTIGYAIVVLIVGRLLDMAPQIQFAVVSAALVVFAAHMWRLPEAGIRANAADDPKVSHGKGPPLAVYQQ